MQNFQDLLPQELQQEDLRTDFQFAQAACKNGNVVNCCKKRGFGCEDHELDANGYCRHLVGWTCKEDDNRYVPYVDRIGKDGKVRGRELDGTQALDVLSTDRLVCLAAGLVSRVYRDVDSFPTVELAPSEPEVTEPKKKQKAVA